MCAVAGLVVVGFAPRRAAAQTAPSAPPAPASSEPRPDPRDTLDPSEALDPSETLDPSELPAQPEPPAPQFGGRGQIAISGTTGLGIGYTSYGGSQASLFSVSFSPVVEMFVAHNFSVGVALDAGYSDQRGYGADGSLVETASKSFSGAVRLGYNVPIGRTLSFWPRVEIGYEWVQTSQQAGSGTISVSGNPFGYPTLTYDSPTVELLLPLSLHVGPHVFASFGPSLFWELSKAQGGPSTSGGDDLGEHVTVGAFLDVGGWFGGHQEPAGDAAGAGQFVPRRFGTAHDFVITNAFALQGDWTRFVGTTSNAKSIEVAPSLDYFFVDHFSIGLALSGSYSSSDGIDSTTGGRVTSSDYGFGVAPRIGANVPMGAHASFWPTLALGIGGTVYKENEGASTNDENDTYVDLSLYAPVLVHPVSHFFVGLGPTATLDLYHSVSAPGEQGSAQNRRKSVGIGLIIGGSL